MTAEIPTPNAEAFKLKANYRCEGCGANLIDGFGISGWIPLPKPGKERSTQAQDYDVLCRPCAVKAGRVQ